MDVWGARLGIDQGRVSQSGGGHRFVLGSRQDGWSEELEAGDSAQISQDVDVTDLDVITVTGTLRTPADANEDDGYVWEVRLQVTGGVTTVTTRGYPGRTREITLTANVSKVSGVQTVTVLLVLVEV